MRLRYLKLINYPPLNDIALCFRAPSLPERECAIRFVVGVNGSGKTHLLQAIAETFLAMARRKRPHFPVTLVYELGIGEQTRTLIFRNPGSRLYAGWWQSLPDVPPFPSNFTSRDWEQIIDEVEGDIAQWEPLIRDGSWPGANVGLPSAVLAYTTGAMEPWEWLFRNEPPATDVDIVSQSPDYDVSVERPVGWSREQEKDYWARDGTESGLAELERLQKLEEEFGGREQEQETCLLIDPRLLKFALLAVTLKPAMQDLKENATAPDFDEFIDSIRNEPDKATGLRRLLAQVAWVWPVSVAFQIVFQPERWTAAETSRKRRILQELYFLATEVVREPEPSVQRRLYFDLKARFDRDPKQVFDADAMPDFLDSSGTFEFTGDGLLQFLGGQNAEPYDCFKRLLDLHRVGLLTDIQIALRKADVDDILLFDELSDGEQVYLGRMAFFHLLKGQNDTLILLDEPEVHFNDKWKREIVSIIDGVLKKTANDVLIATHSSITLTDVFNDEIILFDKQDGSSRVVPIRSTTFGADPSEVMIRLFGVPDSIGERAMEWLDTQMEREWMSADQAELEALIQRVGPGFHRSELRAILRRLQQNAPQD